MGIKSSGTLSFQRREVPTSPFASLDGRRDNGGMRLLATADLHLGSPIRSLALRNPDLADRVQRASGDVLISIVDLAIAEQVDALVISGDIFDTGTPDLRLRAFFIGQLRRVSGAGIPTVLIRGNHDAMLANSRDLPPNAHLLTVDAPSVITAGMAFHGISFETSHRDRSLLPDYPAPLPGYINVGLMHTALDGSEGHDRYAPSSQVDLMAFGYDLWCLGHIHKPINRSDAANALTMPGIPQPRHFGEREGGAVSLITLEPGKPTIIEAREVASLSFAEVTIDVSHTANIAEVENAIRQRAASMITPTKLCALRLHVLTKTFTAQDIEDIAAGTMETLDTVFIDKIRVSPPKADVKAPPQGDLLRLMQAEAGTEAFARARNQIIEELTQVLPPEARALLASDHASTEDLVREALHHVDVRVSTTAQTPEKGTGR